MEKREVRNKNIEIRKKLYFFLRTTTQISIRVNGTYQKRMRRDYLIERWSRFDSSSERVSFDFNFDARIDIDRARNISRTVYSCVYMCTKIQYDMYRICIVI